MNIIKSISLTAVGAFALVSNCAFAQFNPQNIYFRVDSGYSWAANPHVKDDPAQALGCVICAANFVTPAEISNVNNSWLIGVGAGYRFNENFRSEIAYSYRGGYEIIDHDGAGTAISTKIKSNALFLNGYFDFLTNGQKVRPYLGAGVGWANNQLGTVSYVSTFAPSILVGGTTNNFAWNAGFGLGLEVSKGTIIDIGYRYVDLGTMRLDTQTALGFAGYSAAGKLKANEVQFSLRF